MTDTNPTDRTDVVTVRETDDHTVVSVRDTFGKHGSAALTDDQVTQLIHALGGVPAHELRELADRMRTGHEIKHPDAYRCQEEWAKELETLLEDA